MDLDSGAVMSSSEFEAALSSAIAGEHLRETGSVLFDVVLRDVANSLRGSDARAGAIEVARRVFAKVNQMVAESIGRSGPFCPSCGTRMNVKVMRMSTGLKGRQRCPKCALARVIPDLFAM
ncbi:hypothetical protein E3T55_13390 [Cryobacterium frigoriphilum]|uniref:Uncharacterized protein n=1 Tax=Cryobacterium frigoriphilum TaxID=1259150 RepID=A0A4R8ZXH5_9MICO|nr:hypothetical protein [Cryobacterium frigoriphilum]TFD48475.1 hypothetical protein E3T55_13390 [Cryobacterium frigoriphilum]